LDAPSARLRLCKWFWKAFPRFLNFRNQKERAVLKALTALLIYPVVFFLIKDPAALRYARVHGFSPMPQSVQLPLEENGRLLYLLSPVFATLTKATIYLTNQSG